MSLLLRLLHITTLSLACFIQCSFAQSKQRTDVLVIGAGVGGTAASIQAARMGVPVVLTEETNWLGGMMTSAGVSAFDGNHQLPSGIWSEFRNALYKVYGGPNKVATGWVSNTLFEPHVGDSILKSMAALLPNLRILYHHRFVSVIRVNNVVKGAVFKNLLNNQLISIESKQVIDATELGDVFANAGAAFDLGMEANTITHENVGVEASNDIIQDLTYVAILKDYGAAADCTIAKPINYNPAEFDGACSDYYIDKKRTAPNVTAQKMLDYGKLPHQKYMLNWPGYGNDTYLNVVNASSDKREQEYEKAKQTTLRFVYFIQQQLGFKQLGLANDEFPTKDRLALFPYHREGRRVKGLVRFDINHIAQPFTDNRALYRTGIAVGDYPIDHHHRKNPLAPQHLSFYPVPSFNVPLGALIPANTKGLIVAEKGISVTNIVNGTTRLQPCVMLTGQAAGVLAALAVKENRQAKDVSVRAVQSVLLAQGAYIMPYCDMKTNQPHFISAQKIGATGILRGKGIPHAWANQTFFYPDSLVNTMQLLTDIRSFTGVQVSINQQQPLNGKDAITILAAFADRFRKKTGGEWNWTNKAALQQQIKSAWEKWGFGVWNNDQPITRIQLATLLDATVDPFALLPVDHNGNHLSKY